VSCVYLLERNGASVCGTNDGSEGENGFTSKWNLLVVVVGVVDHRSSRNVAAVDLVVEREERSLRILVESRESQRQRLLLASEQRIRLADVDCATSRDEIAESAIAVTLANGFSPLREAVSEMLIDLAERLHLLEKNLLLDSARRIVNLKPEVEAIKHRFVHHASTDEATIVRSLALRVASRNDVEAQTVGNLGDDAVDELALAFERTLKAHGLGSTAVHLVKKKNSTTLECDDHGPVLPLHRSLTVTIDEFPSTDERILVGHLGEVDAQTFAIQLRANLLDHLGLASTRIASQHDGSEHPALNDALDILEVTERNIVLVHFGNQSSAISVACSSESVDGSVVVCCHGIDDVALWHL